jgi:hypothetical protein
LRGKPEQCFSNHQQQTGKGVTQSGTFASPVCLHNSVYILYLSLKLNDMKRNLLTGTFALFLFAGATFGQDIPQSQVPPLLVNNFQRAFPKASDVGWKMDGEMYQVEFETGLPGNDHNAWYDKAGKLIRHKEEISKSHLPKKVLAKIDTDFGGYRADDVRKITEGNKITYTLELKKSDQEWKVAFDPVGNVLSKVAD